MNTLQINSHDIVGGASRAMYRLHQGYKGQGQNSHLLVNVQRVKDANVHTIADIVGQRRSLFSRLSNVLGTRIEMWWSAPTIHHSTRRIIKTELFEQAQVIHFHNMHSWYFNYYLLPDFAACKPVVWTLHDMWALTGHCAYAYDCERWRTGCFSCPLLKGTGRQLVEPRPTLIDRTRRTWHIKRQLYQKSNLHIVTPSHWLCELAKASILAEALSIQCIPNGVDLNIFCPCDQRTARRKLDIPLDAKVILFVAASLTSKRKGFAYLLNALSRIQDTESIVLLTFGVIEPAGEAFQRFRRRDLGKVYDEELQSLAYNAADLFVFPTLADNQPLVLIESLACGTPIVSFDVGGVPEMVRHLETGYLARYKDVDDMAQGIRMLLGDDSLRTQMRHCCRDVAEMEYGLDLQVQRHIMLYELAIEEYHHRVSNQDRIDV